MSAPRPGLLASVEGVDGAGKTTLVRFLAEAARSGGGEVLLCREPGGTPFGERIRSAVLETGASSAAAELLAFAAARAELAETAIRPALERGALVLCDRFTDSTIAYQLHGRGLPARTVMRACAIAAGGLVPDLTFLLDLDPAAAARRRDGPADAIEAAGAAFAERVRAGYLDLARRRRARWVVLDGAAPPGEIAADATAALRDALAARRAQLSEPENSST